MKILKSLLKFIFFSFLVLVTVIGLIIGIIAVVSTMKDRQFAKYGGHGFDYMHGYSSTDFTGYHVYDGEKLVSLDHEQEFMIENVEDMPVLDGAEACYPIYCAIAKTLYKDIDRIEQAVADLEEKSYKEMSDEEADWKWNNGRVVTFTNTRDGYYRLINGEVDLFIGARPSVDQKQYAKEEGKTIVSIPIGKEAFVFFVEEDNPVDGLTSEELRKIYSGEINNWKEVGGKNQKIIAFQRPEDSGSQVMMRYFMGDVPLKEADTMERIDAMGGVIRKVKQYHNENGAIGYTFHYFLTGLNQEKDVKILAIDGVYPSVETIKDGTYPLLVDLVCAKLQENEKEYVDRVIDFMLGSDGQYIIEKTGYGPLKDQTRSEIIED
jgi:phosphate transport system substrate-binding protein